MLTERLESVRTALADRYAVDREIGRGGMACVYLAHDPQHGRNVAIKVLSPDLAAAIGPERFLREIRIEAGLQHPHILPLYDSGTTKGCCTTSCRTSRADAPRAHRERSQLPLADTIKIAREVAGALSLRPCHGIVHRDIKPANILLTGYRRPAARSGNGMRWSRTSALPAR